MANQESNKQGSLLAPMEIGARSGIPIRAKLAIWMSLLVTVALALLAAFILVKTRDALIRETTNRGLIIIGKGLAEYSLRPCSITTCSTPPALPRTPWTTMPWSTRS